MLTNYRVEIEQVVLVSYLFQDIMSELDKMEYEDYKLPYELFKSTRTNKLIAKAIFNLQEQKKPVSDLTVHYYVTEKTSINESEYIDLISKLPVTFDTMKKYLTHLEEIDKDEKKSNLLKGM